MSETPLSDVDEDVQSALAALETADGLVPGEAFPALQTDALRAVAVRSLAGHGRVLLVREHHGISGFTSGYDDTVGERLAAEGIGVLPPLDRAVLVLVLLRTVAALAWRTAGTTWLTRAVWTQWPAPSPRLRNCSPRRGGARRCGGSASAG
ncbi:hypothetical protein [Streptomyces sp. GESEQ-35]|uniref:hypothetical protein n=1 Tax=Streptomyces sp. GESEQ-35 TaxID=2812657 RepID=UPI001B32F59F|nr:hypothetical protein [Streptomyces sp. GESEQ-35]